MAIIYEVGRRCGKRYALEMTHHQRIYDYMSRFGSISPMEAFSDLGETKLSTRIGEVLNEHPKLWRSARKLMRQTLLDFCPDLVGYWLDGIVGRMLACGLIFAAMCGLAAWVA